MWNTGLAESLAGLELEEDVELQRRLVLKALRTPFSGVATFRQGRYIEGAGHVKNLGHGDIALHTGRYLAPDTPVSIELDCLTYRSLPVTLKASVVESKRSVDKQSFLTLVHVSRRASTAHA